MALPEQLDRSHRSVTVASLDKFVNISEDWSNIHTSHRGQLVWSID